MLKWDSAAGVQLKATCLLSRRHLYRSRLILLFMGCFGDCLNHGFSRIQRITRIIPLLFSKIELVFSTIMVSNTTYAAPAGRDSEWDLYGRTKAITI